RPGPTGHCRNRRSREEGPDPWFCCDYNCHGLCGRAKAKLLIWINSRVGCGSAGGEQAMAGPLPPATAGPLPDVVAREAGDPVITGGCRGGPACRSRGLLDAPLSRAMTVRPSRLRRRLRERVDDA